MSALIEISYLEWMGPLSPVIMVMRAKCQLEQVGNDVKDHTLRRVLAIDLTDDEKEQVILKTNEYEL